MAPQVGGRSVVDQLRKVTEAQGKVTQAAQAEAARLREEPGGPAPAGQLGGLEQGSTQVPGPAGTSPVDPGAGQG